MAQYEQTVDESVTVCAPSLVPGLRGRARTFPHWPDPLVEPPLGAIRETNNGYPWTFVPQRMKTWVPNTPVLHVTRNGNTITPYKFHAQPIGELSTRVCT